MSASERDQEAYNQLAYYTLAHPYPSFLHQLVVDAFAAQHADELSKPIYAAFALMGLYLHNNHGFTGKEVQKAHVQLAGYKAPIPRFKLPGERGNITVHHVIAAEPGPERDEAIEKWSSTTWAAFTHVQEPVATWLHRELDISVVCHHTREKSQ